ncbi:unnamed protein product [Bursaphelenchus okinawaensis]|uniref:Uncharacterized protein n=1 Tax=Bursaphelenchus okinawaensis TaxID=465554 RepID=A0A811L0X0_9BILA|nr:unnamed protein product [Bursaphelenchus okinawaensis]CAG9114132.1 unnamed protein product [Bursaphelenchus okinawaensis]
MSSKGEPMGFRRLRSLRQQIKVVLAPVVFAFIPLIWPRKEAYAAYVVCIMAYYWVSQALPIAVTAMIPILAYPLFGVTNARHISTVYFSDSNVLFFGSMVLAVAVEVSNFHERVALKILLTTGPNPRRLLLGFMCATSVLSFFISNTATTALMVPIVVAVIKELENCHAEDKLESQASDEIESVEEEAGDEVLNLTGVPKERVNIYKGLLLSTCFTASSSGTIMLTATGANIVLSGYMDQQYGSNQPITFFSWLTYALPISGVLTVVLYFWLIILFIGFKSFESSQNDVITNLFRKKYNMLGPIRYVEKNLMVMFGLIVTLWLFRNPKVIPGWGNIFTAGYVSDGTVAMFVSLLLFFLPAENPFTYTGTKKIPTIMNWKHMQEKFAWSTFLLLGGGYGIAAGVEKSGLSKLISRHLAEFNDLPDWAFLMLSGLIVTCLTEFSSNVTTASIFIPMMDSLAQARQSNPLLFILPITLSCSYSFMFPAATPPNAIVFGLKVMSLMDMAKAGAILNIVGFVLLQGMTMTYGSWIFGLDSMPSWANKTALALTSYDEW